MNRTTEDPVVHRGIWAIVAPVPATFIPGIAMYASGSKLSTGLIDRSYDFFGWLVFLGVIALIAFAIATILVFIYAIPLYTMLSKIGVPPSLTIIGLGLLPATLIAAFDSSFSFVFLYFGICSAVAFWFAGHRKKVFAE